jgi:hypothetical protein
MADTPNLVLPYLAANQSQKHVTVNEALRRLDALVQVTVQSAALAAPPGSPTEGQRWILPGSPTGAWAGHAGQIAAWQDGAWAFYVPLDGWTAVDVSTDTLLLYNVGTGIWTGLITGIFSDAAFTLQDDIDPTKQARFQIAGFTAGATRIFTLPDATTSLAGLAVAQTFSAKQTLSNANNDLGTSTGTGTTNLATGATLSGSTKTVNIGTTGVSGSTTNVTIGSAVAGALGTLTINSPSVTLGSSVSAIAMAAANVSALYLGLGGATADATNRLSINAPASLFNNAGAALFGKMSMQDFGSRGTVAVGGTTATSGTASDVPASGGALASVATSAALRASIHGTFEITTAGTIIPSIALDVAAAAVVNAGSYFECIYIGPAAALGGSWS